MSNAEIIPIQSDSFASPKLNELASALVTAQSEMKPAKKDASNPFFKSRYATLESCWDAIREPLTKNGLSVVQTTDMIDGRLIIRTTLLHKSGQFISGIYPVISKDDSPQAMGSGITYARRYSLSAIIGLTQDEDDDADAATDDADAATGNKQQNETPRRIQTKTESLEPLTPEWKFTFGKYAGKALKEVPTPALKNYMKWIEDSAEKQNKPMSRDAQRLCDYLMTLETESQALAGETFLSRPTAKASTKPKVETEDLLADIPF